MKKLLIILFITTVAFSNVFALQFNNINADTVFKKNYTIKGSSQAKGVLSVKVNNQIKINKKKLTPNKEFNFNFSLENGRNSIEFIFTDNNNTIEKKNFNIVKLEKYDMLVDKNSNTNSGNEIDGKPTFNNIQSAINSIPETNTKTITIFVKNGVYKQKLVINKPMVTLIGESRDKTILTYDDVVGKKDSTGKKIGTQGSFSTRIQSTAKNFVAENITFENSFEKNYLSKNNGEKPKEKRAVALLVQSDKASFINCRIVSGQDTLYIKESARHYFYRSIIEGDVDFIFGNSTAIFEECDIVSLDRETNPKGYIVAPQTAKGTKYGYVFLNSKLINNGIKENESVYLGRPWGVEGFTAYINCFMDSHIKSTGWNEMSGRSPEKARFKEFGSYGPGSKVKKNSVRDKKLISKKNAKKYTIENIFEINGQKWNPKTYLDSLYIKPQIKLTNKNNATVKGAYYYLKGSVNQNGTLTVAINDKTNNIKIPVYKSKKLNEKINLLPGKNNIIVSFINDFGASNEISLNINYNEVKPQVTLFETPNSKVKKSNFDLTGVVDKDSLITLNLNENNIIENAKINKKTKFKFPIQFKEGKNIINLIVTDFLGNKTQKIFNVYNDKNWENKLFTLNSTSLRDKYFVKNQTKSNLNISINVKSNSSVERTGITIIELKDSNGFIIGKTYSKDSFKKGEAKIISASFFTPKLKKNSYSITAYTVSSEEVSSNILIKQ